MYICYSYEEERIDRRTSVTVCPRNKYILSRKDTIERVEGVHIQQLGRIRYEEKTARHGLRVEVEQEVCSRLNCGEWSIQCI